MKEVSNKAASIKGSSGNLRLSPQFKTLLFSILCVFWHFGNFFLLANNHKEFFYGSAFILASVYGVKVWNQWYVKWGYVVMSLIVQLAGLFFCWQYYAGHTDEKLTHWFGLVYAGYMFLIPLLTVAAAFILGAVYEVIAIPINFIAGRIARAKRIAAQRKAQEEAVPVESDDGTVVYYGSAEGITSGYVDTEKTQMFHVYDDAEEDEYDEAEYYEAEPSLHNTYEAAESQQTAEEAEEVSEPGSAISDMIIDIDIIDDVLPNIVPEKEQEETETQAEDTSSSTTVA